MVPGVSVGLVFVPVCAYHSCIDSLGTAQETQVWALDTARNLDDGGSVSSYSRISQ